MSKVIPARRRKAVSANYFESMRGIGLSAWGQMAKQGLLGVAEPMLVDTRVLRVSRHEYELLRELQTRRRWDWPAAFSTNGRELWPFQCYGYTPSHVRENLFGISTVLDEVARLYLEVRGPRGGRFFIKDSGAFWKDEFGECHQFVVFDYRKDSA
jgi:hypothetical protein